MKYGMAPKLAKETLHDDLSTADREKRKTGERQSCKKGKKPLGETSKKKKGKDQFQAPRGKIAGS